MSRRTLLHGPGIWPAAGPERSSALLSSGHLTWLPNQAADPADPDKHVHNHKEGAYPHRHTRGAEPHDHYPEVRL